MTEKRKIEEMTAAAFLALYNAKMGTSYEIHEHGDAPDIRCTDSQGNKLNLEITLTEDQPGDIPALLGRSSARSMEALKEHLAKVKAGKADPLERVGVLAGNVSAIIIDRIQKKLKKDYGPNTALVVRSASGITWDWDLVVDDLRELLPLQRNPFDKGIWILSAAKDQIFRIV